MENRKQEQPSLSHVEPVLPVRDVGETISYWQKALGFTDKWTWGEPVNHGGVSWHGAAFVQFSLNPELVANSAGQSLWIRAKHLEQLYAFHQEHAKVVVPLVTRPWGFTEYTLQEINGYYITFSAPSNEKPVPLRSQGYRIVERRPATTEFKRLAAAVGWEGSGDDTLETQWESIVHVVVAESKKTGEAIGCAFLMGDNNAFYYVKDVIVHPDWQRNGVGTDLMNELNSWIEFNAKTNATVGLFTSEHLAPFYGKFGFVKACGMYKQIKRS